jgi:hypothetical protein
MFHSVAINRLTAIGTGADLSAITYGIYVGQAAGSKLTIDFGAIEFI